MTDTPAPGVCAKHHRPFSVAEGSGRTYCPECHGEAVRAGKDACRGHGLPFSPKQLRAEADGLVVRSTRSLNLRGEKRAKARVPAGPPVLPRDPDADPFSRGRSDAEERLAERAALPGLLGEGADLLNPGPGVTEAWSKALTRAAAMGVHCRAAARLGVFYIVQIHGQMGRVLAFVPCEGAGRPYGRVLLECRADGAGRWDVREPQGAATTEGGGG